VNPKATDEGEHGDADAVPMQPVRPRRRGPGGRQSLLPRRAGEKRYAYHPDHDLLARRIGDEALAYLDHPLLGPRLLTCTALVVAVQGRSLNAILGSPDDLKFHSSMTLFAEIATDPPAFVEALAKSFHDRRDHMTLVMLREDG